VQLGVYDGDTPVAVKITKRPADEPGLKRALREKDALKELRHDHIVHYYGYAMDENKIYVALEPFVHSKDRPFGALALAADQQVESLTLKDMVRENRKRTRRAHSAPGNAGGGSGGTSQSGGGDDELAKIDVLRQITEALAYMHSLNKRPRRRRPCRLF
jgi:serine/threonine protein kinase